MGDRLGRLRRRVPPVLPPASISYARLLEYDEAHHSGLFETLRTFLAQSGSWTRTADELFLHVNTVRYRSRVLRN